MRSDGREKVKGEERMKKYIGILIMTLCLAFVGQSAGSLLGRL